MEMQVQRNERLTAMGELASGVAHEIRNPLNTISTIIQQLHKDFEPKNNSEEYSHLSKIVYNEVKRINETIQNFLKFARPEKLNPTKFPISELSVQLTKQYEYLLEEKNINLKIIENWNGEVLWDKKQILQVLMNLMENSIDALEKEGDIEIQINEDYENITIIFSDTGSGIPPEIMNQIFNLYFTSKPKGTGLGLSIIQRIIYEHGGTVQIKSKVNSGTTAIIELPKKITIKP